MGIKGLFKLLETEAPGSFKEINLKSYTSTVIAVDASIKLYQYLIQIRLGRGQSLVNDNGEITSHLQGFLSCTISLLEKGIKPIFVFDGIPPEMKSEELNKRRQLRQIAETQIKELENKLATIEEPEEKENIEKEIKDISKRIVKVNKEQTDDVKKLLRLLGIPIVESICESESVCVKLVKDGLADAIATEDMDALTLGAPVLLKWLTDSKHPTIEIKIDKVIKELDLTMDQFIDFCILCGCDYCDTIQGVGPKTALKLIKKFGNIETIAENHKVPLEKSLINRMIKSRELFKNPLVNEIKKEDIVFSSVDKEGLIQFLVNEKGFDPERIDNAIKKITMIKKRGTQTRIDSFFK